MSHTPGPWGAAHVNPRSIGGSDMGWGVIALGPPMSGRIDSQLTGMSEADARLTAAAPDLLEALTAILESNCLCSACIQHTEQARAALAKATGAA